MDPISTRVALGTAGAAGAAAEPIYIEDVFSTYLYTGTGSTQTITNGIDLAGEGGMVWIKTRSAIDDHNVYDTERGVQRYLKTNTSDQQYGPRTDALSAFNSDGFSFSGGFGPVNQSSRTYASWTFRKAEKFFDVVTYTGNGTSQTISHNLGSVPGVIIVKATNNTTSWIVHHRSLGASQVLELDGTNAAATRNDFANTLPTASVFSVSNSSNTNNLNTNYVAYLFAHDAGGFGDDNTESVIKCGSYTGNGSINGPVVDLGWEPQWLLTKRADSADDWMLQDVMRQMSTKNSWRLKANTSDQEVPWGVPYCTPLSTGFQPLTNNAEINGSGGTYIYVAIRRGPMKTPTDATEVFAANDETEVRSTSGWSSLSGFVTDAFINSRNLTAERYTRWSARLTGARFMYPNSTTNESTTIYYGYDTNNGIIEGEYDLRASVDRHVDYHFRRAPGFFDVVAYTGTGSARTVSHNLGVAPDLYIVKSRSSTTYNWNVYSSTEGYAYYFRLNTDDSRLNQPGVTLWNNTDPTSTVFSLGSNTNVNASGTTYIAYLFATLPGISKVGSYIGTAGNLSVDCGFSTGARFVLIKRKDFSGDWYVWDSTRGIVSGNDPYLLLNSSAAENTSTDYIDPLSTGFQISSSAPAAINASGGSYIFLAIA